MADPTPTREELHAALRQYHIERKWWFWFHIYECTRCGRDWEGRWIENERHAPGCLAAPDALKGDDDG